MRERRLSILLRNVLAGFLDNLPNERALDLPFLALLTDMGFEDLHFTHGPAEFGKDFIAKRREGDELIQYSFQSKAGDVKHGAWRSEIMSQMLEAVVSGLSHPSFDRTLAHQAVLVLSGRLSGNAPIAFQEFNRKVEVDYAKRPVQLWDRERLIEQFLEHGPDSFYDQTGPGLEAYGAFLTNYGRAVRGELRAQEIELHSRAWVDKPERPRMLEGALEAELLSAACARAGRPYEALMCLLAQLRSVLAALHGADDLDDWQLRDLYTATMRRSEQLAEAHLLWLRFGPESPSGLFETIGGAVIAAYPVACARAMESAAILYFGGNERGRARAAQIILQLSTEPGSAHPVSDVHVVSLVAGALALIASGNRQAARELLRNTALWVADRYEKGDGLAEFDASPVRELEYLVGFPFDGVGVAKRDASMLATAVCDLAALLSDEAFYREVLNEFLAVDIAFEYCQPRDTQGQFLIEGNDVLQYPNIEYEDELSPFSDRKFANHISNEEPTFKLVAALGPSAYVGLMLVLRDRYFPVLWPLLSGSS